MSDSVDSDKEAIEVLEQHEKMRTMELRQALHEYDVVDVHYDPAGGSHVILAERSPETRSSGLSFPEMGFVDPSPFTSWTRQEHVPELRDHRGLRTFYDMVRADGTVRAAMRILKTPVQGADWYIKPASKSAIDKNIAEFVRKNLFEDLNTTWERVIEDILLMLDFGYMPFEKVWEPVGNRIKLKKIKPIHPLDVQGWNYSENGDLKGIRLEPLTGINQDSWYREIPFSKLLIFVFEMQAGDLRGTSVLRSAFKHFYFKDVLYKIDAIQKERHSIGVPCIKLPPGFSNEDKQVAIEMGRNLRTNERAFIAAPSNWEIFFAKLEGQPVNPIPSIEHHDHKIYENILATFMGGDEMSKEALDTFYKSTRYIAKGGIAAVLNKWVVRELVDMNFRRKGGYPKLMVRRMGEWEETRTMTFALRNLAGAKFLTPDDPMETLIREQLSMPDADPATARDVGKPGGSPITPTTNVGVPNPLPSRQKPLPPVQPPAPQAGSDRRGS